MFNIFDFLNFEKFDLSFGWEAAIAFSYSTYIYTVWIMVKLQAINMWSNTPPWVFFTFLKLHKWYQIAQSITYIDQVCNDWPATYFLLLQMIYISKVSFASNREFSDICLNSICLIHLQDRIEYFYNNQRRSQDPRTYLRWRGSNKSG